MKFDNGDWPKIAEERPLLERAWRRLRYLPRIVADVVRVFWGRR